jgi:hypothetical protein
VSPGYNWRMTAGTYYDSVWKPNKTAVTDGTLEDLENDHPLRRQCGKDGMADTSKDRASFDSWGMINYLPADLLDHRPRFHRGMQTCRGRCAVPSAIPIIPARSRSVRSHFVIPPFVSTPCVIVCGFSLKQCHKPSGTSNA